MKGQPTKTGGGSGPKWKGVSYSSVNFPYERTRQAAVKKTAAKRPKKK